MELPYFGQDLESKKRVVEILAHVCPLELDGALGQEPIVSWSKQRSCCLWNAQKNLQPVNCRIYCSLLTVEYIRPHSVMSDTPVDAFWAKNERERTDVLKCVYSYTCARADIPHHV